jgi:hypothetical protein
MGKASSAKKVARAARAGGSTTQRKRNWVFPAGIAAIVILGALTVFVARGSDQTASAGSPTTDDHWHAAYGIYVCDAFLDPIPQEASGGDTLGIHTHGDGIMHIHPFTGAAAGKNATFATFGKVASVEWSSHGFTMPDGTEYKDGYDCNGTPAVVTVSQWNNADELMADPSAPPDVVYTKDFGSIHYANDRMAFTIAVAPEGTTIPPPQSLDTLNNLTDVSTTTSLDVSGLSNPGSTVPGATDSTVAGATDSTVAGATDSTETTVAGATSSTATTVP